MLISNKLHSFRNFSLQSYHFCPISLPALRKIPYRSL